MDLAERHEQKPSLGNESDDGGVLKCRRSKGALILFLVNLFALITNILILSFTATFIQRDTRTAFAGMEAPFSPVTSVLGYKMRIIDTHPKHSPFSGEPNPSVDQAWSNLLRGSMLRLSEDEMRRMNKTSVALKDESGYVGYLEVYHMLHCLKRLYQSQYPKYYIELARAGELMPGHLDHCMEVLREGIMCNADVAVNTYEWDPSRADTLKGNSMQPRKCVDWNSLEAWADERAIGRHHEKMVSIHQPGNMGPADLLH